MKVKVLVPLVLRVASGVPVRELEPGEHTLTKEEFDHWFIQANVKDGKILVLPNKEETQKQVELKSSTISTSETKVTIGKGKKG